MRHSSRVGQALARLPEVDPAIAALTLWCVYRDTAGSTATEGDVIHIGPEFPLRPISEQTGLIAHHILHVALRHSARRSAEQLRHGSTFHADIFDLACDALVNEALLQGGHALPRPAVRAADLVFMLPPDARPASVLAEWDCSRLYAALSDHARGRGGRAESELEQYMQTHGFQPDLTGSDPDTAEAEVWSARVEQAMRVGQQAGSGIGAVLARLGDLPKAVVPWEITLRRLLNKAFLDQPQQSYRRPSRAWLARDALARQEGGAQPIFEPGTPRDRMRPRLVIGVDTSSSIDDATLRIFAAEAISILRRTGAEGHVLGFDTEVHARHSATSRDAFAALAMRRDGGTDFTAVFEEADALQPSMVIVLTDLDAPLQRAPTAPVLWAVPAEPATAPAFGRMLVLNDQPV